MFRSHLHERTSIINIKHHWSSAVGSSDCIFGRNMRQGFSNHELTYGWIQIGIHWRYVCWNGTRWRQDEDRTWHQILDLKKDERECIASKRMVEAREERLRRRQQQEAETHDARRHPLEPIAEDASH